MNEFICYDRCSTCQKAEKWLMEHNIAYQKRPIKEMNPSAEELKAWAAQSGHPLRRFFNTSGLLYKKHNLKDLLPQMSAEEMLAMLESDGMLVKRPLFISDKTVLLGFREDEWSRALLDQMG